MTVKWRRIMQRNCDFHKTGPACGLLHLPCTKALKKTLHLLEPFECSLLVSPRPWNLLRSRLLPGPVVQPGRVRGAVLPGVGVPLPPGSGFCLGFPAGWAGQHRGAGGAQVHRALRSAGALRRTYWMFLCLPLLMWLSLSRHRGSPDVAGVSAGCGQRHRPPLVCVSEPLGRGGETPGAGFKEQAAGASTTLKPSYSISCFFFSSISCYCKL